MIYGVLVKLSDSNTVIQYTVYGILNFDSIGHFDENHVKAPDWIGEDKDADSGRADARL